MRNESSSHGLTYAELLVSISIIAIFATLAVPAGDRMAGRSLHTKALAHAKQIGLACKLFAGDYGGKYPSNLLDSDSKVTSTPPTSSNAALAQLIPDYIPDEKIFWLPQDKGYCSASEPDGQKPWLGPGENHWAYVTNLSESSRSDLPLIADSTIPGTTKYSVHKGTPGGTWGGKKAIIIRTDGSGAIENIDRKTMTVSRTNPDLEDVLQAGQKTWLESANQLLNPIPPQANPR